MRNTTQSYVNRLRNENTEDQVQFGELIHKNQGVFETFNRKSNEIE